MYAKQAMRVGTSLPVPRHPSLMAPLEVGLKANPQLPASSLSLFSPFLPCKDNQVYVKYVCSFDSPRYLINSITPNPIVLQVFEMRIGTEAFPVLSINVNIFLAVAMAEARVHENTEGEPTKQE